MAQLLRIYVADDTSATNYYEVWFRIVGATNWTQKVFPHPLPVYQSVSPAIDSAYIGLTPLADSTDYEVQVRRWNLDNEASEWDIDTYTTGS